MTAAGTEVRRALFAQLGWTLAYAAVLVVAVLAAFYLPTLAEWRSLLILLPLIPAAGLLRNTVRQFRLLDEMQLRHQLEGVAWAFGIVLFLMVAYALLEAVGWPRLPMWIALIALSSIWSVCTAVQHIRYR